MLGVQSDGTVLQVREFILSHFVSPPPHPPPLRAHPPHTPPPTHTPTHTEYICINCIDKTRKVLHLHMQLACGACSLGLRCAFCVSDAYDDEQYTFV